MIIVGLKIDKICCTGVSGYSYYCFDCTDYHEAAVEVLKSQHGSPWWSYRFKDGELHDTESKRTWHIDSGGHTKRDYRSESDEDFRKRWNKDYEPIVSMDQIL